MARFIGPSVGVFLYFRITKQKGKVMAIIILIQMILDDLDLNPEQRAYNHEREVCSLDYMGREELTKLKDYFVNYVECRGDV